MGQRVAALGAWLGVVGALPAPVYAAPPQKVLLACPDLDGESRASFEARARAELVSAPQPEGEVAVACADGAAVITWWGADGRFRETSVPFAGVPAATVDGLLAALQALRAGGGRARATAPAGPSASVERAGSPTLRTTAAPRSWSRLGAVAGVEVERWQGAIGGALGAHLGARVSAGGRWSFALTAGFARGLNAAQGVRAQTLQGTLGVGYAPLDHLELGLGGELRLLTAVADGAAGPTERHDWTQAATACARYVLALGPVRLGVGPRVDLLAHPIIVQLGGKEVFQLPVVVAGIAVDGATDLGP